MLEIGNGQLTDAEGRSQLALWSLMRAPLISGTDVSRATAATIKTLTATEVLLVSQDSKVTAQGRCVGRCLGGAKPENPLIWAGPVSSHSNPSSSGHNHHCTVVVVINTGDGPLSGHSLQWASIGLPSTAKMSVRDLWAEADKDTATGSVTVSIQAAHDNTMLKLCPAE
jgi:alpha-galactosidase